MQEPIDIQQDRAFTLAIADLGHAHNWVLCRAVVDECQWVDRDTDLGGVSEFKVLKKVGVMRTDACSELVVGINGVSLLQKANCLFF